ALPAPRNIEKLPARRQGLQTTVPMSVEGMSNRELIGHVIENATQLAKKEIELAKSELRADVKKEVAMVKGLGVAGLCAIWAVSLMLVAIALALGNVIPEWAAALIVAGAVLEPHKVARGDAPVWEKIVAAVGTTIAVSLTKKIIERTWNETVQPSRSR